jgi:integrase
MSKRANGDGTVYEDKPRNRWVGEIVLDARRRRVSAPTKTGASAKLREMIRHHEGGGVIVDGHASVASLIELWQRVELTSRTKIAPKTRVRFEWQCRLLTEYIGDVRLRTLSAERIEAMYADLVKGSDARKSHGHASLVGLRSTLSQVLQFGMRRRIIDRNVAVISVIPETARREVSRSSLTVDQAHALWNAIVDHRLGAMWRVGMLTALRPGELSGLLWTSVDLDSASPSITISRNVRVDRGRPHLVEAVKTDGAYRTIGLPHQLVTVLRDHRAAQRRERVAAERWGNAALVFASLVGEPLDPSNVRRELAKVCADAGLPVVSPNELRHTGASIMLDQGMTLEQVAKVLGHNSTRMLERHYRHRIRPVVEDHVAVMARAFDGLGA